MEAFYIYKYANDHAYIAVESLESLINMLLEFAMTICTHSRYYGFWVWVPGPRTQIPRVRFYKYTGILFSNFFSFNP
uniref:Uncharacterized protein n=1 Tax=Spermophilus dauricus TaxID=99837 RepID=A0A8C9PND5_SPEDA